MKRHLQSAAASPEQPQGDRDIADQIGDTSSPYLLTDEAARFLRFGSAHLFRKWAARNRIPQLRRGRTLLYERRVLVAFLREKSGRHGETLRVVSRAGKIKPVAVKEVAR